MRNAASACLLVAALGSVGVFGLTVPLAASGQERLAQKPVVESTQRGTSSKPAEPETIRKYFEVLNTLPFDTDKADFTSAKLGFIATDPYAVSMNGEKVVWSLADYSFLTNLPKAPFTVNPSLWRQAQINMNNGLFEVVPGIYQVRGFDVTNMMIIEGNEGVIIMDPMDAKETAQTAFKLYQRIRDPEGKRKIKAVIFTHSHMDHYGGVKGVVSEEDQQSGRVKILAPEGFLEAAISENLFAGNVMGRRAQYSYGTYLNKGPRGEVDVGIGKARPVNATMTMLAPKAEDIIRRDFEERIIDGVEMRFLMAPETEGPTEMLIWFPQFQALCAAEDMNHTNHNLYTLRGATVRDGKTWWKVINTAIEVWGDQAKVMFFAHTWPVFGNSNVVNFMKKQRDLYKYVHDQSLNLANQGYTMVEIGERLQLPDSLAQEWFNRDYYGTVNHNAKAVYQRYLGWFDSNPANLHPLPPTEAAKRYVEYMGGSQAVIKRARMTFQEGDYRWVAQVLNHVVFAEPWNIAARELQADAFEQMGYQSESGIWRNHYLTGAMELRSGIPANSLVSNALDQFNSITLDLYFDYLGILLNGPAANGKLIVLNWKVTDTRKLPAVTEEYVLNLENSALTYMPYKQAANADASLVMTRETLNQINTQQITWQDAVAKGLVVVDHKDKLFELLDLLMSFKLMFPIVTP